MKILLSVFFLLIAICLQGQVLEGKVTDSKSGHPLPYVNVYLKKNLRLGTVASAEGDYRLDMSGIENDSMIVTFMGYERKAFSVNELRKLSRLNIALTQKTTMLHEVVIMPRDTIFELLKKAFSRIETNYPSSGVLVTGLYRETNQLLPEKRFLYFSECIVNSYKPGYATTAWGPVQIIEGGKAELVSRKELSPVYFFGGIYALHKRDFVKERIEFINPRHYSDYTYEVQLTSQDNRAVYAVRFSPLHNASYEGVFYLDQQSLAYIGAEYQLAASGLQKRNSSMMGKHRYIRSACLVKYRVVDGTWQINLVVTDGTLAADSIGKQLRYTAEFVSTGFQTVPNNPIRESEAILYSDIYTEQGNKFNDLFWQKPEVISRTIALDSAIGALFKRTDLRVENNDTQANVNRERQFNPKAKKMLTNVVLRTSFGMSVGVIPVSIAPGYYSVTYSGHFRSENNIATRTLLTYDWDGCYYLTKNLGASFHVATALNSQFRFNQVTAGLEFRKRIVGYRRPFFISPGVNAYYTTAAISMGEADVDEPFNAGGTRIDASKIQVYSGEKRIGILPSIQATYHFASKFSLYLRVASSVFSQHDEKIFIKEVSGSMFKRNSANLDSDAEGITLERANADQKALSMADNKLYYNLGIRIGLK